MRSPDEQREINEQQQQQQQQQQQPVPHSSALMDELRQRLSRRAAHSQSHDSADEIDEYEDIVTYV